MRNKILYTIIAGAALLLGSCNNFLDQQPVASYTPENYLNEESQLASYGVNLFSVFPTHGQWSFGTFGIDAATDNMTGMSYDNKYIPGQWKVGQTGGDWDFSNIRNCNYFLNNVEPKRKAGLLSGSNANIKHYIGEVYMIRAFVYFDKLQKLGDFPIIKSVLPDEWQTLTDASKRQPCNEVARFIIQDLDSAINLMQTTAPDGKKNRLSKYCAYQLKSRVALFEATWLKYFKGTAFVPNGTGWPGASKDYNKSYQYPSGSIDNEINWFLDQAIASSQQVADNFTLVNNTMTAETETGKAFSIACDANPYCKMFADVDMSTYSEVLFWRQYSKGLGITHNVPVYEQIGNDGVGTTRGMVDGFLMKNGLPIYASGSGYLGDDSAAVAKTNRDGRLWLFLKTPGQVNVLYTNSSGDHATPIEPIPMILVSTPEQKYNTGYAIRKGLNYDQAQCANGGGYTGAIVFRAVESYLNYIEAYYERYGSLNGKAQAYWQAIRNRAGVDPDFNKTIAATDMSQEAKNDWGAYSAGSFVDKTLYNIRRERRCEMMAEGLRWMDLKRWRALDQMITTPYHIEGFKLWGPMQSWYATGSLKYGIGDASNVSSPTLSQYLRPYEMTTTSLAYNGYKWAMAHYLSPIAIQHFLITSKDGSDVTTSPIYQNPGWSTTANTGALN
ncbi:MAG: RagB/SusD family nutrient uptake outer membrane protein [Bacteroidota bacterium]|nr:RagB/SusD family nutrient uptake outer membrane protein [Bacteroidota bacterium]